MTLAEKRTETLRLIDPDGTQQHVIAVNLEFDWECIELTAFYVQGHTDIGVGALVAQWTVDYVPSNAFDDGCVSIGRGRIDIEVSQLRGIGLGSLLMQPLIVWIQAHDPVSVAPINLSGDDARTEQVRDTRNRFYEKLGFLFDYRDDCTWGESHPMRSDDLKVPPFCLSRGWCAESIDGSESVFSP